MELPTFDLRLLGAFVAVAEEQHFGRAAVRLGLSQPTLSHQIGRLERQLAIHLLDRSGGPVTLTPAGAGVLAECRAVIDAANRIQAELCGEGAVLRVHLGDAVHPLVTSALATFTTAHPGIAIQVAQGGMSEATRALAEGTADVGFDLPGGTPPGMSAVVLDGAPLGVVCAPEHPLAARVDLAWTDLAGAGVVTAPPGIGDAWNALVRDELDRAGVSVVGVEGPRVTSNLYLVPFIVGRGAVLVCTADFHRAMPSDLVWRPLSPERDMEIAVIWDDRTATPTTRRFVDAVRAAVLARPSCRPASV